MELFKGIPASNRIRMAVVDNKKVFNYLVLVNPIGEKIDNINEVSSGSINVHILIKEEDPALKLILKKEVVQI